MKDLRLGEVEERFATIIWENEPLTSGDLVKLAEAQLNWKKSTTYTVLKKLCERGLFENNSGLVRALISHEEFHSMQSEEFVDLTFNGSLPAFIAAFTSRKKLSDKEISEIKKMIESIKED
ncbi:MAG: BlaI/MecI/CopY family transcriptional regulator [Clostridia bacterium]|nr:BlaI/MecI/CopY family transcriptional regulator [Clostridia bacterium]